MVKKVKFDFLREGNIGCCHVEADCQTEDDLKEALAFAEKASRSMSPKKDYSEAVSKIGSSSMLFSFQNKEDTQLIVDIINLLAEKENMTVSRASRVLKDAQGILPIISTI